MKKILLYLLKFYQKCISPYFGRRCRFYPTCSEYSRQAITKYGALKDGKISKITQKLTNRQGSHIHTTIQYISDNSTIAKLNFKNEKGEVYSTLEDLEKALDAIRLQEYIKQAGYNWLSLITKTHDEEALR